MKRMVIVGAVTETRYSSKPDALRVYRLDTKAIKDIKDTDLAPVADRLGLINFSDLQIPEVRELYPLYSQGTHTRLMSGANACFVLGTFGDGGYVCIRPHIANDYIRVIPRSRLVGDVKKGNLVLLNAVVEQGKPVDVISPLVGVWDDMSYLKGRSLVDALDDTDDSGPDARDKIGAEETVDAHDELGMLNAEQKEFLKNYYIDYSVDTFNKLVGKSSWTLKQDHEITETNKKRRESKLARLAELRTLSGGSDWRFAGLWDVGYQSSRAEHKCEFGHKLRYIYMACPAGKSMAKASQEGTLLQFGIKCHADFLNIPAEEASRLGKLLDTMCSEISFISTVIANTAVSRHNDLMISMHELLGRLQNTGNLQKVLGDRLAKAYQGFVSNKLPLVESFVLDVMTKLDAYGTRDVLSASGFDISLFAPKPTDVYSLPEREADTSSWANKNYAIRVSNAHNSGLRTISRSYDPFPTVLTTYADMLLKNDIAGEYMYNPQYTLTDYIRGKSNAYQRFGADEIVPACPQEWRKYKYGYNADTRELRRYWMDYFLKNTFEEICLTAIDGTRVRCLTMHGLDRLLLMTKRLTDAGLYLNEVLGNSTVRKLCSEVTDVYRYQAAGYDEKYKDIHKLLLLTALPYTVDTGLDKLCRRAASYALIDKASSKPLFDSLDATKDGTDPDYIAKLLAQFTAPKLDRVTQEKVDLLNEKVLSVTEASDKIMAKLSDNSTTDEICEANKSVIDYFQECNDVVCEFEEIANKHSDVPEVISSKDNAYKHMTNIKNQTRSLDTWIQERRRAERTGNTTQKTVSTKTTSKNPYRGDVEQAKRLADDFTALYETLPKIMTANSAVQIALDIIKRFRTKFQEKEGFTSKEEWRVNNELERLKRLKEQNT